MRQRNRTHFPRVANGLPCRTKTKRTRRVRVAKSAGRPEPEEPWYKLPGNASRVAFTETVKAWESSTTDAKDGFLIARGDLFLDGQGDFDASLEADFWREVEIFDLYAPQSIDLAREEAAEFRASRVWSRRPAAVSPAKVSDCPHNDITEILTHDGFFNRQCRTCGEWLPCRKAEAPAA